MRTEKVTGKKVAEKMTTNQKKKTGVGKRGKNERASNAPDRKKREEWGQRRGAKWVYRAGEQKKKKKGGVGKLLN